MDNNINENKMHIDNIRKELAKVAINSSAPFYWIKNMGEKSPEIGNGTIFFLDTGERQIGITAYHVYEGFLDSFKLNNKTKAQIGNEFFDPTINIIDSSKELDLITFQINKTLVEKNGNSFFWGYQSNWPPNPPEKDGGVFFAGYPGNEKILETNKTINWGIFSGLCVVKSITDRYIYVHFEGEYVLDMPDKIPRKFNSAGISGAALIKIVRLSSGLKSWCLAGIIYEAQHDYGLMFATRSDFITGDGKIKKI